MAPPCRCVMFGRDNIIGVMLLGLCAVVAAIMIYYIALGERPTLNIGTPVSIGLAVVFFGLLIYGSIKGGLFRRLRGGQRGSQWPDPNTGRPSLLDRLRGRKRS